MKRALVAVLLFFSVSAIAKEKPRAWTTGTLNEVMVEQRNGGVYGAPIGTGVAAVPIIRQRTMYRIVTTNMTYLFADKSRKARNLTINGAVRFAIDGQKAYVIDDAGKELKMAVIGKALRQ